MSFGSFSLSRSWKSALDYARLCATVALIVASNACIGFGFRLLRWSRVASGLPFSVFSHCLLEPFDWKRSASGPTLAHFEHLNEDSPLERASYGVWTSRFYDRGRARLPREVFIAERVDGGIGRAGVAEHIIERRNNRSSQVTALPAKVPHRRAVT